MSDTEKANVVGREGQGEGDWELTQLIKAHGPESNGISPARYGCRSSLHSPHSPAEQGLANYCPQAKSGPLPVSVK